MDHKDLCEHTKIRLIAATIGHQQCTKTAANLVPIPDGRFVATGTPAEIATLLGSAEEQLIGDLTDEQITQIYRAEFNGAPGAAREAPKNVPTLVIEFARSIERAAIAAHLARQEQAAEQHGNVLHNAIMNLPCERTMSHFATRDMMIAYKEGHRDARHAAAELTLATPVSQAPVAQAVPEGWMLAPKPRGRQSLAYLIQQASLACIENRVMEPDDRHEFAQYADLIRNSDAAPTITAASSQTEELVRFCPCCGSIGEVEATYRDCCPDGSAARNIPKRLAEVCRDTFKLAISSAAANEGAQVLKGVGKINGDGWKDVTRKGEVVFVWNTELPRPYKPGQFPRIGNNCGWSASTDQYDFQPATAEEARQAVESIIDSYRATAEASAQTAPGGVREAVARAIWNLRREEEDRCDMELEDMGEDHSVWKEADAAIRALQGQTGAATQDTKGGDK